MRFTKQKEASKEDWQLWFAWVPMLIDDTYVWLEYVWRRGRRCLVTREMEWEYALGGTLVEKHRQERRRQKEAQ